MSLGALAGAAGTLMVDGGPRGGVVATLAPVGDDAVHHRGFSLERPMDLRVYALGEGIDGEMYDYAWIVDASSRTPVWAMRFGDTQHAGGASKNRMVDQVVSMNAGDYILYYVSDGSHSSQSWNSSPPSNPDHWGVTLLTVGERDGRAVKPYDPRADDRIIAQLVGATDDDHLRQRFALDRETEVRVYAIGEGIGNEMYDYAWIEDGDSRRVVWEMRYQHTDNAGGAEKNRVVNGTLRLPAGEYVLHYATDDSHSFNDWNEAPPVDAFNYGVTLFKTER